MEKAISFSLKKKRSTRMAFLKEMLLKLKTHIELHTLIVEDFNIQSHQWMAQPDRKLTKK